VTDDEEYANFSQEPLHGTEDDGCGHAASQLSQDSICSEQRVKHCIIRGSLEFVPEIWDSIPDGLSMLPSKSYHSILATLTILRFSAQSLARRLMHYNHLRRATVMEALESRWIALDIHALVQAYETRVLSHVKR
jgi:hypothetical protein